MTDETASPHSWRPRRFMVIVGHPDDADFGPAGAASAWIDAGSDGWLVCCTSGDAGGEDPDADPLLLARAREEEQRQAARVVGYKGVSFLHQPDGYLVNDVPLREMLVREIRTFKPDAVFTGDPEVVIHGGGGINHTDHRAAAMAVVDAVYPAARNPMAFPWLTRQGLPAHHVRRLYLMWSSLDRRLDDRRSEDRSPAIPRQPAPRSRGGLRPGSRTAGRTGCADRHRGGRGLPAGGARAGSRGFRGVRRGRGGTHGTGAEGALVAARQQKQRSRARPVVPQVGDQLGATTQQANELALGQGRRPF
jgi:Uncharacterized proteins, LmbE homologs